MERVEKFASKATLRDMGAPKGQNSWFCLHPSDFCFGDQGSEGCNSFEKAVKIVLTESSNSSFGYQFWLGHQRVFKMPVGRGATRTN